MRLRHRHLGTDPGDSDFPIPPLLDLAILVSINVWSIVLFLLLLVFRPTPAEGRLPVRLSPADSDPFPNSSGPSSG
jgi:hypothetical protein